MQSNLHFFVVAPIHIDEKLYTSEKGTWEVHVLKWQQVAKCMFLFCHFQIGFSQFPVFDCCSNLWFRSYKFCLYKASCLLLRNGMKSSKLKVIGRCWRCFAILQRKEGSKINFFLHDGKCNFSLIHFYVSPLNHYSFLLNVSFFQRKILWTWKSSKV